jgi:hypothetical protein
MKKNQQIAQQSCDATDAYDYGFYYCDLLLYDFFKIKERSIFYFNELVSI